MTPKPLDRKALQAHPLPPVVDDDKDSKGSVLIVAGSRAVPGAALLAANGAMRAGAGKLRMATVESIALPLGIAMPEAMVIGLAEAKDGGFASRAADTIEREAAKVDAVVAGPGVKPNRSCQAIARALLKAEAAAVALDVAFLETLQPSHVPPRSPPVLLPDTKELGALLRCDSEEVERDPVGSGRRAAERYRSIVLVKGPTSHVVTPDGSCWRYDGGALGLGVSGSGDVLAGIVGGLLARGAEPLNALLWAVWLHGEAGASLAKKVGRIGFLAREIPGEIAALLPR